MNAHGVIACGTLPHGRDGGEDPGAASYLAGHVLGPGCCCAASVTPPAGSAGDSGRGAQPDVVTQRNQTMTAGLAATTVRRQLAASTEDSR
jgi:hypothetical protein